MSFKCDYKHIEPAHVIPLKWETDASPLAFLISKQPTPYKIIQVQWETHKQLFASHMTQRNVDVVFLIPLCPRHDLASSRDYQALM